MGKDFRRVVAVVTKPYWLLEAVGSAKGVGDKTGSVAVKVQAPPPPQQPCPLKGLGCAAVAAAAAAAGEWEPRNRRLHSLLWQGLTMPRP